MGNLHSEREIEVINPPESPYLHITRQPDGGYLYLPSLDGLRVGCGTLQYPDYSSFNQSRLLEISLLPGIDQIPPPPYRASELVENAINRYSEILTKMADLGANAFNCSHGSGWGFLPEEEIKRLLIKKGFSVLEGSFPRFDGRKRIQGHLVIIP